MITSISSSAQGGLAFPCPSPQQSSEIPLSFAQQQLWSLCQWQPEHSFCSIPAVYWLVGSIDMQALTWSFTEIVRRHVVLRTTFTVVEQQVAQRIIPEMTVSLSLKDIHDCVQAQQEAEVLRIIQEEIHSPFDLTHGPVLRASVVRLNEQEHLLLLNIHHMVADSRSLHILLQELALLYQAYVAGEESPLQELPLQYVDVAQWQHDSLQEDRVVEQLTYWCRALHNAPTALTLPTDQPRPPMQSFQGRRHAFPIALSLGRTLEALSRQEQVSLHTTLLAAWTTLLYRYSGQEELLVGLPVDQRTLTQAEGLIGLFEQTLPLRINCAGQPSFRELLRQIQDVSRAASAHSELPFANVIDALQVELSSSHAMFGQVLFDLQSDVSHELRLPGLISEFVGSETCTAKSDLALKMISSEQGLVATFEYSSDLFEEATICRMAGHFERLLASIVENPDQSIAMLPLLSPEELEQLLVQWNDTAVEYPRQHTIHELVQHQAETAPQAIAAVCGNDHLTYAELNERADLLASYLCTLGVGPDVLVGVYLERSLDMLIGQLGVLKAGGAYIPIDPAHPRERLAFLVEDSQAAVVLTHRHLLSSLPERLTTYVCLDSDWEQIAQAQATQTNSPTSLEQLAYVIYTSGSTGAPKGVAITHANLLNLVYWHLRTYQMRAADRCSLLAGVGFDASVWEIWPTLAAGACLYIVDEQTRLSPQQLRDWLVAQQITLSFAPTPLAEELLALPWPPHIALRFLLTGGDKLHHYPSPQLPFTLVNHYGPTECTVLATATTVPGIVDRELTPSIGRPIANTQVYVLDRHNQPVPIGVAGELYIGGAGVSRGYHRRPELAREKFLANPLSNHLADRLYKTGDLVRYLPDGNIEFLERIDHQVKIRGFRIELGEIEAHLTQHPAISEAVVIAREDTPGNKLLVAYMVPLREQRPTRTELRGFLKHTLPEYMIPAAFVFLESIPLNANGKVDRKALPAPQATSAENDEHFVAPSTPTENTLADLWRQLLGIEQVGREDNFFELGGHSLLATRLVAAIRDAFMVELPLPYLFDHPTLAELASVIDGQGERDHMPTIQPTGRSGDQPLSFAQRSLWFLHQWAPDSPLYNIVTAYRLVGQINVDLLERSINEIVRRHAALRTTFPIVGEDPIQCVARALTIHVKLMSVDQLPETERERAALHLLRQEGQQPFDLTHGPLLRVAMIRLHEQEHLLLLNMHHIISDGWSMAVFVRELVMLYEAYANEQASLLPEVLVQYIDFAEWQQHWLQGEVLEEQLTYWRRKLIGVPRILELPTDHPRPPVQTFRGAQKSFALPPVLSDALRSLSRKEGVTLFMTLLAAWATLLHRYSGQEEFIIGVPIANRMRKEVEQVIGFFANTLALRIDISGMLSFQTLLHRIREVALEAYSHQDVPFEKLVKALHPQRHLSHNPLFQVMFAFQNEHFVNFKLSHLTVSPLKLDIGTAMFDLTLEVVDTEQGLSVTLEYSTDLFEETTIGRMAGHFQRLLSAVVADPSESVTTLSFLSEAEVTELLFQWNATASPSPRDRCIHSLFEEQVERTPEGVAVICEDGQLSYRELNERANRLAHYLRTLGVGPEVMVGISMERSLAMIVGLFGILKAGGAYVPIDPTYPRQRQSYILQDAQVQVLITTSNLRTSFEEYRGLVICLDTDWCNIAQENGDNPRVAASLDNLMYVIYTSGSTGASKGVMIPHRAVCNHFCWMQQRFPLHQEDGVLQHTSFSFDVSVWELFAPLLQGVKLVLAQPEGEKDPAYIAKTIAEHHVTILQLVPSLLRMLLEEPGFTECVTLRRVFCGGEAMPPDIMEQFFSTTKAELVNMYGPTETCIDATCWVCSQECIPAKIPIGRPIGNAQAYILDKHRQLVPIGGLGELYIGGHGLARGYLKRPELTDERFVANPFSGTPGTRLYKTGDLVRYLADGNIEFLGRIDHQVKIRGFRIELGEIETALAGHPAIHEAVVLAREYELDSRLLAYVVFAAGQTVSSAALRSYLRQILPEYMIPSGFVIVAELPLTPNGKVDRTALAALESVDMESETAYVAPRTATEMVLAELWATSLGRRLVGIHDNFFNLGGNSLLATRIVVQVRETLHVDLPLRTLFESPTVAALTMRIAEMQPQAQTRLCMAVIDHDIDANTAQNILAEFSDLSEDDVDRLLAILSEEVTVSNG